MSNLILREEKGSPLTHEELDNNIKAIKGTLNINNLLHVEDRKPAGTSGGTFTSGAWRTRDLNTVVTNTIAGASLASNQVTLPAGEYWVEGSAPASYVDQHKVIIKNITDILTILEGTSERIYTTNSFNHITTHSKISGFFVTNNIKSIELQHRCLTTRDPNGFGRETGLGSYELYSVLKIWKVG
ncbi:MAG: hypothetical protein ACOC2W_00115 [bacterium]